MTGIKKSARVENKQHMINYNEPIYDPFNERGPTFYHPGNDAAMHLIVIQLIYRDIGTLLKMRQESKDNYKGKLLLKYVIIEVLSIDKHTTRLANMIISGKTGYTVESNELTKAKDLYKQYKNARKENLNSLKVIRDKLAAHRESLDLLTIANLWDSIDIKPIRQMLEAIPPLFNFLKGLKVYCWAKSEQHKDGSETVAIIQPFDCSKVNFVEDQK